MQILMSGRKGEGARYFLGGDGSDDDDDFSQQAGAAATTTPADDIGREEKEGSGSSSSGTFLPRVVVFDLDACCWYPEMYMLSGGAPFQYDAATGTAKGVYTVDFSWVPVGRICFPISGSKAALVCVQYFY